MISEIIGIRCTGCEACSAVCPKNCIEMKENREGFYIPNVKESECINCECCVKSCPVLNFQENHKNVNDHKKAFAFKSDNETYRGICSSGGTFMELAKWFVDNNGVVYGAAFDEIYEVKHKRADNINDLISLAGSKYVQSKIDKTYINVKNDLSQGLQVLFVGLTCQIEGLKAFLKNDYDKLYCVDLICMGIPSPMVWRKYLETYFDIKEIKRINFKDKRLGWHKFSVAITKNDGEDISTPGFDDKYMECMFKGYSMRESCFSCVYKCENKISDLTIADCWGCENYIDGMDDNRGLSMIIVHSKKGEVMLDYIASSGELRPFEYNNVLMYNSNYYRCANKKNGRSLFYWLLKFNPKMAFSLMGKNPNKSLGMRIKGKITKFKKGL